MMSSMTCNLGRVMTTGAAAMWNMASAKRGTRCAPAAQGPAAGGGAQKDLVRTAEAAGSFRTLLSALNAAGMTEVLQTDGPFTVFAPNDEAFERLPEGTLENLLKPENREQLKSILSHHVVSGRLMATDVVRRGALTPLGGKDVVIRVKENRVLVDGARVLAADVNASNGTIHIIDTVLL